MKLNIIKQNLYLIKYSIILYFIISIFLLFEYKYTKKTASLDEDGFAILGKVKNEHCLNILPKGYKFINYKYSIKGCSLSTFHRDVTSSQYIFKTKYPIYTFARYLNTGPHISVCPGSHKTAPFLFSNPYSICGE